VCFIVENTLQARYLALERSVVHVRRWICGRKDLIGLLIQELVIVAKM
jgi:hypothetical protein